MSSLVTLKNNEPLTTSLIVSEQLNRTHKGIYELIKDYENDFNDFGLLRFETAKPKIGRPIKFVYLNEQHLTFLIMMLRVKQIENDRVLDFKKRITKEFFKMRKWILEQKIQKANQEYIEMRKQSKIGRRLETDIIKQFVEYATKQGSKSANKYYMNISEMENKAFFVIKEKFKNVREILNITQLSKIMYADIVVRQALLEGMEKQMFYKDIYQLAKNKVIQASETLPKEIIPGIKFTQIGRS